MAYNYNPTAQQGTGAFALVPGALDPIEAFLATPTTLGAASQVSMPNPFGDLSAIYPNLGNTNNALSALISSQISGELSPQEQAAIQDARARYGVASGMSGSGLNRNATVRDLGLATGTRQQQGVNNYNSVIPTISNTQTVDPSLQAQINIWNANQIDKFAETNANYQNQFKLANQASQNNTNQFNTQFVADRNATYNAAANPEASTNKALEIYNDFLNRMSGNTGANTRSGTTSIQGGGGQTGLGTSAIGNSVGNYGSFASPGADQNYSGTGGGNSGSVLGGSNTGQYNNNWNANSGPSAVQQGTYTFGSNAGSTNTNANIWQDPWSILDGGLTWASGIADPFKSYETTIPQSGSQNNWGIFGADQAWA